ncbi:MAG: glycoside hydrolase family 97 protein, partial [bacterium]|nr:glycoside hydrolase family 97 protein [bacterium]
DPKIIDYGKSKGIGTWLWLHWTGVDRHMNEMFPLFEKWGAVGLKIDFMNRDDQWMVNWYHRVLNKAAEHRLMVDFHGAYKPTGIRRTYPNLMTREGVIGLEYTKWSQAVEPEHNVTIPFTRGLAGPMDVTPGGFGNVTRDQFKSRFNDPIVLGTRAHQLAAAVVFESPYLVLADHPSAYRGVPAFQFYQDVPATWDETRVLNARVADYITVARRSGDEWFIGSMTDWTARDLDVPLSFLGPGTYTAEIYADGADAASKPTIVDVSKRTVDRSTMLRFRLAPGGGQAIRIHK